MFETILLFYFDLQLILHQSVLSKHYYLVSPPLK